jgi:LacI family transcriptional regulator
MSIHDLAKSLGLSVSTVSRALNGYSDVSASTRARVEKAAREANYRPHAVAHRLATGRTGAVALVSSVQGSSQFDASFEPLMHGVAAGLAERGYFALSMALPSGAGELPGLERVLDARLVDAVILTRTRPHDQRVALLQTRGLPFVTHGRTQHNAPHAWVDTDNERAMRLAVERLVALGHRRIALIDGPGEMNFSLLRRRGFEQAVKEQGLDPAVCPATHGELSAAGGQDNANRLLQLPLPPTALVCASDVIALGAAMACKTRGLRVGADVSITGYGNTEPGAFADPPLATIDHQAVENGRHLAALLLRRMDGEDAAALHWLEPVHFIERLSIGPAPR